MTLAADTPAKVYAPRDPAPLARTVVLWIQISLGATALGIATALTETIALGRLRPGRDLTFGADIPGTESFALLFHLSAFVQAIIGVVAFVLFLKWIYRTSRNAHALAGPLKISPPWAVGWFFVPIANFVKPLHGMREVWQASQNPAAPDDAKAPPLVWNWWKLWVVANLFAFIGVRASMQANEAGEALIGSAITLASLVVSVFLCLTEIKLVRELTAIQVEKLSERTFG